MQVPPSVQVPELIAKLPPLTRGHRFTKRLERISLELLYLVSRRKTRRAKLEAFRDGWAIIEKDTLAARLAGYDTAQHYGSEHPRILKAKILKKHLRKHPDQSPIEVILAPHELALDVIQKHGGEATFKDIFDGYRQIHTNDDLWASPPISPGSFYRALDSLKTGGYLSTRLGEPDPHRAGRQPEYYRITESGRELLRGVTQRCSLGDVSETVAQAENLYRQRLKHHRTQLDLPDPVWKAGQSYYPWGL